MGGRGSAAVPHRETERVGLQSPVTYGEGYERLRRGASRARAAAFVSTVLALRRAVWVQGWDLI